LQGEETGRLAFILWHAVFRVILTERASASGWKDLGQRRASAAGSGFELLPSEWEFASLARRQKHKERCAISETGTGFANAKLSEVLPPLALLGSSG
jgi:hypothetical protein